MKKFIENKMAEYRLTQSAIARKIGISQATVNNILSGAENIREDVKYKIARAFNVPINDFIVSDQTIAYNPETAQLSEQEKRLLLAFRDLDEKSQLRKLDDMEELAGFIRSEKEKEKLLKQQSSNKLKGGGALALT